MNLRFTPPGLALALSMSASARNVSKANLDATLAKRSSFFKERVAEKFAARRLAKQISTSIFEQEATNGRSFYNPDVGILQGRKHSGVQRGIDADNVPRFLQAEEAPKCGANGTCAPSFCTDMGSRFTAYAAAVSLNAICNGYTDAMGKNWTFEGCFDYVDYPGYPGLQEYLRNAYCRFAQCAVDGGTYDSCYCQLYHDLCEKYGDKRPYNDYAPGFCKFDACCQNKTGDAGIKSCMLATPSRNKYCQENPRCGTNGTCSPSVCNCYTNGREECAAIFKDMCNGVPDANGKVWSFEGCYRDYPDYPDFQMYHRTMYCDSFKCIAEGGTYGRCNCQMIHTLCEEFGDVRKYHYDPTIAGFCAVDTCCQSKTTEAEWMVCLSLKNSTATNSPTTAASNPPETPPKETSSSTAQYSGASSIVPLSSSVGVLSSLLATAAAMSIMGCDAT